MKLKTRIRVYTIGGLVSILVFFSLLIYVFFVRFSTNAELRLLWNRAQTILRKPEIRSEQAWQEPDLLQEFLSERMMVRIIDPAGKIRIQASNDPSLVSLSPVYRTNYHTRVIPVWAERRLYIQVPILTVQGKHQIGVLELAKSFHLARGYLRILLITLTTGTLVGILVAICAAFFYVKWIYRPVGALAETMEQIEQSGSFTRLDTDFADGDDEFGRLGGTFNRMMDRLEENYRRQRHFVEDASHELRTPLTVIQSYAGMLQRWGGEDPAIRQEAVSAIQTEADRLKELVAGLLQSADNLESQLVAPYAEVDLLELAGKTAEEMSLSFGRDILLQPQPDVPFLVNGNGKQLKQMLINLLDNAIKYSSLPVNVHLELVDGWVVLQVLDQGDGIDPRHLPRIFERFYRVDEARTRSTGGSGLGLSIVERIVKAHGGTVGLDSARGKGTTATVRLPSYMQEDRPGDQGGLLLMPEGD
ncbi:Signal transduction histidine-protein kinase ArlS [compost metagenome]